jgi:uncharacterized membrane protein YhaH (DUF805 family)
MKNILKIPCQIIDAQFIIPARINRSDAVIRSLLNFIVLILMPFLMVLLVGFIVGYFFDKNSFDIAKFLTKGVPIAIITLFTAVGIVNGIRINIARLHDINYSGWWLVLMIIPIVNFFFSLTILLAFGTKGENKFGQQPAPSSAIKVIFAVILTIIWVFISILSLVIR